VLSQFPTIKVIEPPKGQFSTRNDQWCLTYCSQNITGRIQRKEPWCRSVCIRKVFTHEVRDIVQFKSHRAVGPDGKARYPLPSEGQPTNLPRYLGGKTSEEPEDGKRPADDTKHWDEGWYLWKTNSFGGVLHGMHNMRFNLEQQAAVDARVSSMREVWKDYQDFLRSGQPRSLENKWLGPIVPPAPFPDHTDQSLLVHLPLDTDPLFAPIRKVLGPSQRALQLMHENFTEGNYQKFALRVYDKAWTGEPLTLAKRAWGFAVEQWKDKDKGSDEDENQA